MKDLTQKDIKLEYLGKSIDVLEKNNNRMKTDTIRQLSRAVLKINLPYHPDPKTKYGTGFFISKSPPLILTAHHVIPDQKTCFQALFILNFDHETTNPDLEKIEGGCIMYSSKESDFSLIQLSKTPRAQYSNIRLPDNNLSLGVPEIFFIHHPFELHKLVNLNTIKLTYFMELQPFITPHIGGNEIPFGCTKHSSLVELLTFLKKGDRIAYWESKGDQLLKCTEGGSSGAPIFNKSNEIIGMHQGSFTSSPLSFGIPINLIKKDLDPILHHFTTNGRK